MTSPEPLQTSIVQTADAKKGIFWMLVTMLLFVTLDAVAKILIETYPVAQVVWGRFTFHVLLLTLYLNRRLPAVLRTGRLGLQLLRSVLLLSTTILFFAGLLYNQLATASAIMFVGPLVVTALSMPLLKEHVGPRRWAGVFVGFTGALVIIRPGTDMVELAALLPLGAAFTYALYQIATRLLSHTDQGMTTLFYTALLGAAASTLVVPFFWITPDLEGWLLMAALGMLGGVGHFCMIRSLSLAPAATVVPFTYSSLIWATLYGFTLFGDLPDLWTVAGALIIAGSGLYIFHREQQRRDV